MRSFKLDIFSPDPYSILNYNIIREELTSFDGDYEVNVNNVKNFFKIRSNDGFIELNDNKNYFNNQNLSDYMSILVVVQIQDLTQMSTSTECTSLLLFLACLIFFDSMCVSVCVCVRSKRSRRFQI
jgi:hypothetical protein